MAVELVINQTVAEITLSRPEKLNAIDEATAAELMSRLDEVEAAGCRALLVRGEGRGFSAGRDLAGMTADEDAEVWINTHVNPVLRRLAELPLPTFAAVHGPALGIGLGLALACDVVIAADNARFGSPFANIGAVLDSGGHWFLVSRLGSARALDLIYSARLIDGAEAARMGLISRSVPVEQLLDVARQAAAQAAAGPTRAFALSKRIVARMAEEGLGPWAVAALEAEAQRLASTSADYREGMAAFAAKRPPTFLGR